MAGSQEKFRCIVSKAIHDVLNNVSVNKDVNKTKSIRFLIDLALENMTSEITIEVAPQVHQKDYNAPSGFFITTKNYRIHHNLGNQKSVFFGNALARGASVYLLMLNEQNRPA